MTCFPGPHPLTPVSLQLTFTFLQGSLPFDPSYVTCKISSFEGTAISVLFLCSKFFTLFIYGAKHRLLRPAFKTLHAMPPPYLHLPPQMRLLNCNDQLFIVLAFIMLTPPSVSLFNSVSPTPCTK